MIRKNGPLDFDVNAYTSSSVSTSINFWTQDRQTARLIFKLTKDGVPLPLAAVTGKLVLVMSDGSRFIRDVTIVDRVNGQAEYVLSDQEIKHYGNVQAELNLYYTNDQSMSVHQFSFHISKSLIDQDIVPITEYYVDEFEALREKINALYEESIQTINDLRDKFEDLEKIETKQGAQSKVDAALKAAKKYTDDHAETPAGAEDKATAALEAAKEYVKLHLENKKIHVTESEKSNWNNGQLHRLTPNDGKVARLPNGTDIFLLPTGFYMGANLLNLPVENDSSFYYFEVLETSYVQNDINYKRIIATRSFDNMTWIGTFHAQGFRGWKRLITDGDAAVTWKTPSLSKGWKQYVSSDGFPHTLRYSKDASGVVEIIGSITGGVIGNDVEAFTLLEGFFPLQSFHFIGVASSLGTPGVPQYHRTYIGTDGRVCVQSCSNTVNPNEFITFGVRFKAK
ncbi:BppU family phage baseplate upper protein [Bacillus safensis]|uniref:BppU family phage baseplate upper protein n=1 Tax=Bacillus safensis TaxID=561879 RepID=UPI002282F461|nr:BppU family phage baseplate upper protein [Bacillus safensis]MCY7677142.1 BppU family phage baseplate upper protein [Bacillus safensis]MEC3628768.1 BppU family phage baseplate upper protein [Bacillus safensis]